MILKMERKDIPEVVRLHKEALAGDFFVLLGDKFLSVLYQDIINSPCAEAFVFNKDNRVIGFTAAYRDQNRFYRSFIVSRFFTLVSAMAKSFAVSPLKAFSYFLSSLEFFLNSPRWLPNASIISLAVAEPARGTGVGKALFEAATGYMKYSNVRAYWLMTEADNTTADNMYKKSGLIPLEVRKFGFSERRFYIKNISSRSEIDDKTVLYILRRKILAFVMGVMPLRIRYAIVEKLRLAASFLNRRKDISTYLCCTPGSFKKRPACKVVFSFDVDRAQCWDNLDMVLQSLRQRKLRATFNFLTEGDYDIDWSRVRKMKEEGHEIGLHGKRHDLAFGYRKPFIIRRDLAAAFSSFAFKPNGFRSPGLSASNVLLDELSAAGFRYDSSVMSYEQPFLYKGGPLWELPICAQDTRLFFDQRLSCEDAASFVDDLGKKLDIAVLNFHPCYAKRFSGFYERLYDMVIKNDGFSVVTMNEVVDFLEKENKNA